MIYKIDQVNWPESFPEKPEVTVEVSNDRETLFLKWHVKGEQLRAVTTEDQGPVWEDSCVEFFCQERARTRVRRSRRKTVCSNGR